MSQVMPEDMDIIPEDENVKRQFASWKVKQENVRFFEQSALNLEMDRLSLKRSEEDLERLRTELGLPVATGMKIRSPTPRMPAPSQTAIGGHPLELNTAEAEELTEIVKQSELTEIVEQSVRPKLSAAVS